MSSTDELRAELELRRAKLQRSEGLARTGPPRSRFAYAAAATKQRAAIAKLERELQLRTQSMSRFGDEAYSVR